MRARIAYIAATLLVAGSYLALMLYASAPSYIAVYQ